MLSEGVKPLSNVFALKERLVDKVGIGTARSGTRSNALQQPDLLALMHFLQPL